MSVPSFTTPVLDYVGSVDVSSSDYGTNQFILSVDPSQNTLGSLIMFEYKIQTAGTITDPSHVLLGYISMDAGTSFQLGNSAQYQIGVPAEANVDVANRKIQVRAYTGLFNSTDIVVSPWSNELEIYNPPEQPVLFLSYYDIDASASGDDLFIFMDPSSNLTYDWATTEFVVAYYYATDPSNDTVWQVSEPLTATDVVYNVTQPLKMLQLTGFGTVSSTRQVVYVAVYAVNSFSYNGDMYYSVSHISTTDSALPQSAYAAPTITSIDYAVYVNPALTYPGNQNMTIHWDAPLNSLLPTFAVDHYILEYSTNLTTWNVISSAIPSSQLSYVYNPWNNGITCGNTVTYRVRAVSTLGTNSPYSNLLGKSIFSFATAPQNLAIPSSSFAGGLVNLTVTFNNPVHVGCGTPGPFVVTAYDASGNSVSVNVPYHASPNNYTVNLVDMSLNQVGNVDVLLQTTDTNSPFAALNGQVASAPYLGLELVLDPIDYQVYVFHTQNMVLSWSISTLPAGWSISNYDVYLSINDGSYNLVATTSNSTYTYLNTQGCGDNLKFQVQATASYGSTNFPLISNEENINVFKYSLPPASSTVEWAIINPDNTVDMLIHWTNPTDTGCGTPVSFLVNIYNSSSVLVRSYSNIAYVSTPGYQYEQYVDAIDYTSTGTVEIRLKTLDTNSSNLENGDYSLTSFTSQDLPVITNVVVNNAHTQVTFDVETAGDLVLVNLLIVNNLGTPYFAAPIFSYQTSPIPGQSVTKTILPNGISNYHFVVGASVTGAGVYSTGFVLAFSNSVGISSYQVNF